MNHKTRLLIRDAFLSSLLSSLLVLILALLFFNIRFFNPFHKAFTDFSFLDVFYSQRFVEDPKKNTDIILVNVGRERYNVVDLLHRIIQEDPKVIGVDVMFDREKSITIDTVLSRLLQNPKVVTAIEIKDNSVKRNHEAIGENINSGYVNFNFDTKSSVIREFQAKKSIDDGDYYSFAAEVAKKYLGDSWYTQNYLSKLENSNTIKYFGDLEKFQYLSIEDFNNYERKTVLKDKIIILGYLGTPTGNTFDIEDKFFTPLNPYFTGRSDADMFGTVIHANIVNMLIKDDFMTDFSGKWIYILSFIILFLSTMYYMKINKKYKISFRTRKRLFQFVTSVLVLVLSFWLFRFDVVLKPTLLIFGIIIAGSYFKYYKHLTRYLKTKTGKKWKTYLK